MRVLTNTLKTSTTALSLFLQSALSVYIGLLMIYDYSFFVRQAKTLLFVYFWFVMVMNVIQLCTGFKKGVKQSIQNLFTILGAAMAIWFLYENIERIIYSLTHVMYMWTFLLGLCSFISFIQYRKEKDAALIRYLLSAILHIVFSVLFMRYFYHHVTVGIRFIGLYLILIGVTLFLDGMAQAIPDAAISRFKNPMRMAVPAYMAAFLPLRILNSLNTYLKEQPEALLEFEAVKSEQTANILIFVHVSKLLKGTTGHVDIAIGDTIYCYGTYDRESLRLGGIVGTGVLYEVYNKEEYLNFCMHQREETIFEFGLALSEEELARVYSFLEEMKSRTKVWQCKAQRAKEQNQEVESFQEPACRLAKATHTVFYKFENGSYKYYWFLGTNCVKFTDDIIRASGMPTIFTGIMTPGTYFTFLNGAFMKGQGNVVSRRVHYAKNSLPM